ncbi:MAG TPA: hypothetical protein VEL12_16575 [Candidatus Nitrosopolaris sp.]|nr:hypothetical protein [Candidatus Nitrosopolaris sp.]
MDKALEAIEAVLTGFGGGGTAVGVFTHDFNPIVAGAAFGGVLSLLRLFRKWNRPPPPDDDGGRKGSRRVVIVVGGSHYKIGSRNTHRRLVVIGALLPYLIFYYFAWYIGAFVVVFTLLGTAAWFCGLLLQYLDTFFSVTEGPIYIEAGAGR